MRRSINVIALVIFCVSLLFLGLAFQVRQAGGRQSIVPSVQAKDKGTDAGGCPGNCSLQSLNGCYASTITGHALEGPLTGPVAGVVLANFDGQGGFKQVDIVSINGNLVTPPTGLSSTGTYTVNPDCTGTGTINPTRPGEPPLQFSFVLTDHGREFRTVLTNPGFAVTSIGTKQ